jgi:hypothetical protein
LVYLKKEGAKLINRRKKFREFISHKDYVLALNQASLSSLGEWYAELLDKALIEISNFDIIRSIRQNVFVDEVIYEAIQRMLETGTALYSEDDCIELMEKLASVESKKLLPYKGAFEQVFENMARENSIEKYEMWMYEEEKDEFRDSVNKLRKKIDL